MTDIKLPNTLGTVTLDSIIADWQASVEKATSTLRAGLTARQSQVELLVDATEAGRLLGMSASWMLKQTDLPFRRRIGKSVRYSVAGIAKWVETRPRR